MSINITEPQIQLLTFMVDGEEYGVDILRVQEIRSWSAPMPLPNAPAHIKGVINIRGDIVCIADLRERLGLPRLERGAATVIIVLRAQVAGEARIMGVIVDAVSDVADVPQAMIKAAPKFHGANAAGMTAGIAAMSGKLIMILAIESIFDLASAAE